MSDLPQWAKPKSVLMTADTVGGVFTYALDLARELTRMGVHVSLATMGRPLSDIQAAECSAIDGLDTFESCYKLEWMDEPWDDVARAGEWLLELEQKLKPDVVHVNGFCHGALEWAAPRVVVGHSCVLSWWRAVKGERAPAKWDRYRNEVTKGLKAADLVVAPTCAMLSALEDNYGTLKSKRVIVNGRDISQYQPSSKEKFVLTAGRIWDQGKNIAALERIAPDLSCDIYIAGEESEPARDGKSLKYTNVKKLGRLAPSELSEWYSLAAVYAMPARYEPFGLSILEAALSGCALVLGDIPSLREIWHEAAIFVDPDDQPGLRSAIEGLLKNDWQRSRFSARARRRATLFTSERMASAYVQAYSGLLANRDSKQASDQEGMACV
jgi:glycogen synthase